MKRNIFLVACFVAVSTGIYIAKEECPPNEEYLLCGTACPFNCSSTGEPVTCSTDCVEGCFCKTGYLRNDNETCVPMDECFGEDKICGPNEEFLSCGTACAPTCAQPEPIVCGLACSMGCFCAAGYVRDTKSGKCVTLDKCPPEPCFNENEVYDVCNANCEPSCEDPLPLCTKQCSGGCVCASGYLRSEEGDCVTADKCANSTMSDQKVIEFISKVLHV